MTLPDQNPLRLSALERDEAVAALRTHLELGRLSQAEFDERAQAALAARTAAELGPLFADLPAPHPGFLDAAQPTWPTYPAGGRPPEPGAPGYAPAGPPGSLTSPYGSPASPYGSPATPGALVPRPPGVPPVRSQTDKTLDTVQALIWPIAIVLLLFGDAGIWPIILAIVVSTSIRAYRGNVKRRQPPPY
ncbi:MAG: DUF1707 domain-containing protein [Propionibacterium sp.]|nr:DUF1707 domain-containing protein [Propionibacterium sp.]